MVDFVVIYEDNHLLALHKPAGLLTQPSGTDDDSLEAQAKLWLKEKYQKKGNVFLEAVHRIDKVASGIVLFAKTSKALSRMTKAVRERHVDKFYRAWVEGVPENLEGTLEDYLFHGDRKAYVVNEQYPGSKVARLHYRVVRSEGRKSLLEIDLETGRYHQIRAQLAHMGHPILGDNKYGAQVRKEVGISLCHCRLVVPHPISGESLVFEI